MVPWREYQEQTAAFFFSLGLDASTDVTLQGARTTHAIDVLVKVDIAGFEGRWLVECKHWNTPVSKLHVLALREIVSDLGSDRGIILCEKGFQSGAYEAAALTNVQISSLAALKNSSKDAVYAIKLRNLYDRIENALERYWEIPKLVRIEHGLRPDIGDSNIYSGDWVAKNSKEILSRAFRGLYPIHVDPLMLYQHSCLPNQFNNHEEVAVVIEQMISDLENRLTMVEQSRNV